MTVEPTILPTNPQIGFAIYGYIQNVTSAHPKNGTFLND
jgi:hypothetical protein